MQIIKGMGSTLRFVLDHDLNHCGAVGATSASLCTVSRHSHSTASSVRCAGALRAVGLSVCGAWLQKLCAVAFGKEEGGGFEFSQEWIDYVVNNSANFLTGHLLIFERLADCFFVPMLHLCISGEAPGVLCPVDL